MIQMRRSWSAAMAVTAALMTSVPALADSTATVATPDAANASVANTATPAYQKLLNRMSVTFISSYYGASTGKISDPYQPDEYGRTGNVKSPSAMFFDNTLPVLYKVDDHGTVAGFGLNGAYTPVLGKGFVLEDPYLKIGSKSLIKSGGFSFAADLRDYLPVSKDAHNQNRVARLRSIQVANYDIPNTKWSINSINSFAYYVYGSAGAVDAMDWYIAINPNINYQAFSTLGIWAGYESDSLHNKNQTLSNWNNDGTYLYLGLSWDATSKFNFSPYLSMRPGGAMNADSTQVMAYLTYKVL